MKIIVDTLGADHSPDAEVEGALLALRENRELKVVLVGDEKKIQAVLDKRKVKTRRIEIVHAPDVVTGNDLPTDAIRLKKDSSMMRAIRLLREDDTADALVSNGATGVLVAASILRIGRIEGVRRPALCPIVPSLAGDVVGICDSGANTEVTPEMLQQFAVMGSRYMEAFRGMKNPRVGLLNIGTEEEKGDDLRREAYQLLKKTPGINFTGNMEAREFLSGTVDMVVCDGFSGNVLAKCAEGTALEVLKRLKRNINTKKRYQLGGLLMKKMFAEEKENMNYLNYGGCVLLGTEKVIVKGHGSSDRTATKVSILQACRMVHFEMNEKIRESLARIEKGEE
jgi:glycerol-3-phosphate acyltransferase PlsX